MVESSSALCWDSVGVTGLVWNGKARWLFDTLETCRSSVDGTVDDDTSIKSLFFLCSSFLLAVVFGFGFGGSRKVQPGRA